MDKELHDLEFLHRQYAMMLVEWERQRRMDVATDSTVPLNVRESTHSIIFRDALGLREYVKVSYEVLEPDGPMYGEIPKRLWSEDAQTEKWSATSWFPIRFLKSEPIAESKYVERAGPKWRDIPEGQQIACSNLKGMRSMTCKQYVALIERGVNQMCDQIARELERECKTLPWIDTRHRLSSSQKQYERITRRLRDKYPNTGDIFDDANLPAGTCENNPTVQVDTSDWLTVRQAAKRVVKELDGTFNEGQAKTRITRACDSGKLRHRGKGRDRRVCPESLGNFILGLRNAALPSEDEDDY